MSMDVSGRVAIVTGAASGIGRASALELARAGAAAVVVVDVDAGGVAATADLVGAAGAAGEHLVADVGEARSWASLLDHVRGRHGRLDILHSNAGLVSGNPPWPGTSVERIEQLVRTNVLGPMVGTRLAVDLMAEGGGGVVVHTASVAGLAPMPADAVYAATKAAVILFTQSCAGLAESYGVRVNAVLPGMVDTDMIRKTGDGEQPAEWLKPILAGGIALQPDDVARAVRVLVEDDTKVGETMIVLEPQANA
jgi:NAD(P)-dependent dehydrogenase (short-subunit alcohol dehydrogenase family)